MKKLLFAALILSAVSLSSHAIGLYFDGGIGFGPGWTEIDGEDWVEKVTNVGTPDEMAIDLGLKLGLGPFDTIPIYIVGVFGGMGHRISDTADNYYQFNSYLIGPGVIFYPSPFVQIAGSLGYSYIGNDTSFKSSDIDDYDSKGGFAGDISIAFDFGAGNHGLIGGLRFFGATNTLETVGVVQNNTMVSFFVRYAFRHKR